jgi:putative oxidoreductase
MEPGGRAMKENQVDAMWSLAGVALRIVLGGLFIYSGGIKLLDPGAFQIDIANFDLIPIGISGVVAVGLPWLELVCGLALLTNRLLQGGALLLGLLMAVFILFVASAWTRGLDVACGCFGASDATPDYPLWIGRNLLILGGLAAVARLHRRTAEVVLANTTASG